jgi:hypothetical protein
MNRELTYNAQTIAPAEWRLSASTKLRGRAAQKRRCANAFGEFGEFETLFPVKLLYDNA